TRAPCPRRTTCCGPRSRSCGDAMTTIVPSRAMLALVLAAALAAALAAVPAQALAATALGRAPAPGESLRLSGESILRCLRAAGLDDATVYTIPAWVRVT